MSSHRRQSRNGRSRRTASPLGYRLLCALLASLQILVPTLAAALPSGGQVAGGQATISQPTGTSLQIQQATDKAILNWQSFSIGGNEAVRFMQPSISSIALNRIVGGNPSVILGQLQANGRIFLINPNGILFGAGAQINVGGLLATTLQIRDEDFMAGRYLFAQDPLKSLGTVINRGDIRVSDHGFVILTAPGVANEGLIVANLGKAVLASGQKLTVDLMGDGLINYAVSEKVLAQVTGPDGKPLSSAVSNSGTIQADGGQVVLSAKASGDIFSSVVNQGGIVRALSLVDHGGVVRLEGSDPVANTGTVGWQANQGKVQNADGKVLNTGLIDVSAAEVGAAQGQVTITGEMVGAAGTILGRGAEGAQGGRVLISSTDKTVATSDSVIDTSGVGNSTAGNVVIWSDKNTTFGGTILAQGGALGGNGGRIEVSGHENLGFFGQVNALAPRGITGSLLLDPMSITVATGGGATLVQVDQFSDTPAANQTIDPATINAAAANVTLQANSDITVTNAIAMPTNGVGITMQAGRDILVNAGISTTNGNISLTANDSTSIVANRGSGANGDIIFAAGANLSSGTGNITLTIDPATAGNFAPGSITTVRNLTTTTGNIVFNSPNTVSLSGTVNAGSGTVTINTNTNGGGQRFMMNAGSSITTTNATAGAVAINVNTAGGGTGIAALRDITTGNGGTLTVATNTGGNATGGDITQTAGTLLNVGTGTINLSTSTAAGRNIGTAGTPILTTAGTISATGGGAGIFIQETNGATISSATTAANGNIQVTTTTGDLTVGGNVTAGGTGNVTLTATSGDLLRTAGTVTGNLLTLTAGGANGDIGTVAQPIQTTATNLAFTGAGTGNVFITESNGATLNASSTGTGNITVTNTTGNLTVGGNVTTGGTGTVALTNSAANAVLTINGGTTVTGPGGVTYTSGNMTLTGATNAGANIATLQPNTAGQLVNLGGADAAGTLGLTDAELDTVTAGILRAGRANSGNMSISAALTPAATTTLSLISGGTITQTAAITETNLGITSVGAVTLNNAGNTVNTLAANITGAGNGISYTGLTSAAATPLTIGSVDGINGIAAAGNVAVTTNTARTLTVAQPVTTTNNGTVTLTNAGTLTLNADISADGAVVQNGAGTVTTTGTRAITTTNDAVSILQPVTLSGDFTINSGTGPITFSSTVNGAQSLTANSTGTTTFAGAVGNTTALTSLTTNAGGTTALNGGTVTTTGNQTYNDAVTLGLDTTLTAGAGNLTFGNTVNGAQSLTANSTGTTTFAGAVGNTTALTSLTTNAGGTTALNGGTVTTTGAQTYNDAVLLSADTTLTAGAGNLTFGSTLNSTVSNTFALTANSTGTTTFGGAVGGTDALSTLTTNAGGTTALNGGPVTTTGAQTYNDAVTLGAGTTLTSTASGNITLGSTVDGAQSLAVNTAGATTFGGIVGGTTPLASVTTDQPGTVTVASATTTGAQTYSENTVTLNGTYTTTNSPFTPGTAAAAITLGGNTTVSTGTGNQTFNGTVNGAQSLTANSTGTTTFNGAIGNSTPLTTLTTNAGGTTAVNGGSVTTTGTQTYGDAVTMNQATTLTSTGGTVQFDNTVTNAAGGASLTVDAPTITLNAATTVTTTNGNLSFFTDTLNTNGASINAGTGAFAIAPNTVTKTIEFGDTDTARATDVYYSSNFGSIVAGSFTVGRPTQTGDIFITGVANLTTPLTVINGGTGELTVENAALTSPTNSNVGLVSGSGGTTLAADVNVGTGTLRITTPGAITQSAGALTADTLALVAGTGITVAQAGNDVATLAAQTTVGNIAFRDSTGVGIGSIGASVDGFHPAITGLTAGAGNVAVSAGGAVTQTAPIVANGLSLQGTGPYTLTNASNDVTTLAATTTGGIQFTDLNSLTVGTVPAVGPLGAVSGITAAGQSVTLATGDTLTQTQPIVADSLTATTLNNAGAAITLTNPNNAVTTITLQARNATDTADASGAITYRDTDGVDVAGGRTASTFDLTTNGPMTESGALVVAGITTLAAGAANDITLTNAANNFSTVGITSGNNVALVDANALDLAASTVSGTLNVTTAGALTQSGPLSVAGLTTLAAGAGNDITLTNAANDFSTVGITSGNNVALTDATALDLAASTISGTLNVTAGGLISQSGALAVAGNASFTTTAAPTLGSVSLANSGALTVATSTVGGNLTATTTAGDITLPLGQTLTVAGDATLTPAGTVNLLGTTQIGGTQSLNGGTGSTFVLAADTNLNTLALPAAGNITVNLTGTKATFAGAPLLPAAVILANAGNTFGGTVSVTTASPVFTGTVTNTYNLTQSAAVTLNPGQGLTATDLGGTAGTRGNITLPNAGNTFNTVTFTGGDIAWQQANAVTIGSVSANAGATSTGALTITATGPLTQTGAVTAAGTTTLAAGTGNNITLTNAANDFSTVGITSGNNVALTDATALDLAASTVSGTLTVTTAGALTQSGALTVAGLTTLAAGAANDITLTNAANNFSTVGITSGNNATLQDTNAIGLGTLTLSGTLSVTANGPITDANGPANNITAATANLAGASIGTAGDPIEISVGTLNSTTTAGGIFVTEANAVTLGNVVAGAGDVTITNTTGDMTINTVTATAGGVNLTAAGGSILDGNAVANNVTASANSTLNALGGVIGVAADPIEVNVNGATLGVAATNQIANISATLNGTVLPSNTLIILNSPPGLVLFNGVPLNPPPTPVLNLGILTGTAVYLNPEAIVPAYYLKPSRATLITNVTSGYLPGTIVIPSEVPLEGDNRSAARTVPHCTPASGCLPGK